MVRIDIIEIRQDTWFWMLHYKKDRGLDEKRIYIKKIDLCQFIVNHRIDHVKEKNVKEYLENTYNNITKRCEFVEKYLQVHHQ